MKGVAYTCIRCVLQNNFFNSLRNKSLESVNR